MQLLPTQADAANKPDEKLPEVKPPTSDDKDELQRLRKGLQQMHDTDLSTMTHEEIDARKAKHFELMEVLITKNDEHNVKVTALLQQVCQAFVEVKEVAVTMGRCEQFNKYCKDMKIMIETVKIDKQARADQDAKICKEAEDNLQKTMNQFIDHMKCFHHSAMA